MSDSSNNNKNEMGNIVSGSKDILSSSIHWPEGNKEEETGQNILIKTEQSDSSTESETMPEQPAQVITTVLRKRKYQVLSHPNH